MVGAGFEMASPIIAHFPSLSYLIILIDVAIQILWWQGMWWSPLTISMYIWGFTFIQHDQHDLVRRALHRMGVPLDQAETLFDIIDSNKMGEAQMDHDIPERKN